MNPIIKFIGYILMLIATFAGGFLTNIYTDGKNNAIKFIDIQSLPAGGLAAANIKDGVKASLSDEKGKKIDGYNLLDVNIFNYSGRPISQAKVQFEISRSKPGDKAANEPLRALSINILRDGMINEAATKTITTRNDKNGTLILTVTLTNLSPDTTLEARHKISITIANYQSLTLKHAVDGDNIKSRDFEYQHALEADDPYVKYKEIATSWIPPVVLLGCLLLAVIALIFAHQRDKKFFKNLPDDIEAYLKTQAGLSSGGTLAPNISIEIRDLVRNKYIENIPKLLRPLIAKP